MVTRKGFLGLTGLFLAAVALTFGAFGARAAAPNVVIDGRVAAQSIDGFGVNLNSAAWNQGNAQNAVDQLINLQGSSLWRVIIEQTNGWEETNDNADPFVFNWTYYNALYETPKFKALWASLAYLRSKGQQVILNVMGNQPGWLGSPTLAYEDEWVEMVVSLLYYARHSKGLVLPPISPLNEMDLGYPEGPKQDPASTLRLFQKLSARLNAVGMSNVQLIGPETASMAVAANYTRALMSDASLMGKIRTFAYHDYSGNSGTVNSTIAGSAFSDRRWLMTEYAAWCPTCDAGGTSAADEWNHAKTTVQYLFQHLSAGASGACVYDAMDSNYEHHGATGYWGQLSYDGATGTYTPRKRFWALTQIHKFVRPGSVRIGVTTNSTGASLAAFYTAGSKRVTLVGLNRGAAFTLNGSIGGLTLPASLRFDVTDQTANFKRYADVPVSAGAFTAAIPADSIFTLSGVGVADTIPPTAPTSLVAQAISYKQVNLTWNASTDNLGTPTYNVFRNGVRIAGTASRTFSDLTVGPATAYSYHVTAQDASGNVSASSNLASVTTPAAPTHLFLDAKVATHQNNPSSSINSPPLSTSLPNELVFACLGTDGPSNAAISFASVSGGGLAWKLLKRVNTQHGASEIWQAVAPARLNGIVVTAVRSSGSWCGSMTLLAYANADTAVSGAVGGGNGPNGAASAALTTTKAGSFVIGVGNDWDQAISRTFPAGQTKLDEFLATVGDTFWVQSRGPVANSGTSTVVQTLAPTTNRWNLAVAEVRKR